MDGSQLVLVYFFLDEKVAQVFQPITKCRNAKPKQITFETQAKTALILTFGPLSPLGPAGPAGPISP